MWRTDARPDHLCMDYNICLYKRGVPAIIVQEMMVSAVSVMVVAVVVLVM